MADRILFPLLVLLALGATGFDRDESGRWEMSFAEADDDDGEGDDDDDDEGDDDDDDDDDRAVVATPPPPPPPPPEFVVALPNPSLLGQIEALGYAVVESQRVALIDAEVARLQPPAGVGLEAARAQIAGLGAGTLLDLNTLYRPNDLPCGAGTCAAFDMVNWAGPSCSPGAAGPMPLIGMIDTGVNAGHPSLAAGSVETVTLIGKNRVAASAVHGTAVALLFSGAKGSRTPGLLPEAQLLAAETFHRAAGGGEAADVFDIVRAMDLMAQRRVDVVNMSFSGGANALLERALAKLSEAGIPVAAAVGNGGPFAEPLYPAAYPQTIAVTAVDKSNAVYRQAGAGAHVDLAAPGVRLWTAASVSGGRLRSGTSYAVPFVSAALALERLRAPAATPDELQATLAARAVDLGKAGRDETFGWGLVQMPDCILSDSRPASDVSDNKP